MTKYGQKVCACVYVRVFAGASVTVGVPSVHQRFLTMCDPGNHS